MSRFISFVPAAAAAILTLAAVLPGSSIGRDATIRLPDVLASNATRYEFAGFGGFNKGNYDGAGVRGEFTRGESRLGVFDPLYVSNRGKSSFTLLDDSDAGVLSAQCELRRSTATLRVVTLDVKKMAYECSFDGAEAGARMVLGEPKRSGFKEKLLAKDRRSGEANVFGQQFAIESIHEYAGSKLDSQSPLGYVITAEGQPVAAVDLLDWNPIVHLPDTVADAQRQAVIAVALTLAVLRDPSVSALED